MTMESDDMLPAEIRRLFTGYDGLAALQFVENACREQAVAELV